MKKDETKQETKELQTAMRAGRQDWIDLARCIAMLIVMMNHIGLVIRGVNFAGGLFYVPVFFVLSGYVRREKEGDYRDFVIEKAKRLLVPFFITNMILSVLFLLKDYAQGNEISMFSVFGFLYGRNQMFSERDTIFADWHYTNTYYMTHLNAPTWFLPALFLTVISAEILLRTAKKKDAEWTYLISSILLLTAVCWNYLCPFLFPWSLDALPVFLGFFLMGHLLANGYLDRFWRHKWLFVLLLAALIPGALLNGSANFSIGDYGKSMMLGYFNALCACVLLIGFCYLVKDHVPKVFAYVGRKTLPLLCWHYPLLVAMEAARAYVLPAEGVLLMLCKAVEIVVATGLICLGDEVISRIRKRV